MIIAHKILQKRDWHTAAFDTITLEEEDRHRRRLMLKSDGGLDFLLSLKQAERLHHGDGLLLDTGQIVEIQARPEALYEVRAGDPHALLQLSWHLGNRHQPTEILPDHLRIRQDHVIAEMLTGLGAELTPVDAPFSPMNGAYAARHKHG
ncbi:MAG: urease accessory protein UreE [Sneathiella sp.]